MSESANQNPPIERLVIVGSGPAGWTAAIYAARANLAPLVYEGAISEENRIAGTLPLGQLNYTTDVENFPGFPEGVQGPELMMSMRTQAERYGTRIATEDIVSADLSSRPFKLLDSTGATIYAQSLIIATGASANYLGLESENRYKNHGVSACAVCDGALPRFRNRPLVVVGGGDSACEEAAYLTKFASVVHLVHRRDSLRASKVMADRTLGNAKISPVWNSAVDEVIGEDVLLGSGERQPSLTSVRVKNLQSGETRTIEVAGMFVAIGHTPNTRFLNGQLETDEKGFIKLTEPQRSLTNVEGVFACGDVCDPIYKQAITAAGSGCKAALDAERWLAAKGIH